MNARFDPSGPLRGRIRVPSDKSISHRAAILGAMAAEPVCVRNYLHAADTDSSLAAIRELGAIVHEQGDELVVRGVGLRHALQPSSRIDVGNAGTLLRLLPGWLALQQGKSFKLDGDESIRRRPVDRIAQPLEQMGARIVARDGRYPPFTVEGAPLTGIEYRLPVASAQVKSCLLLAGLGTDLTVVDEPMPSRDHTERMLLAAEAPLERQGDPQRGYRTAVGNVDELALDEVEIPGDPSSAAFLVAAGVLVPGSRFVLEEVGVNWTRCGYLRILERMGAIVLADLEPVGEFSAQEPRSEVDVSYGPIVGVSVEPHEVPLAIDELPLVALLGAFAEGETVVRGAGELRLKESDRITSVVEGLRGLGASIEATGDGFAVQGSGSLRGGRLKAGGDHRLALLGAVAGLASQEGVEVVGMEAADVSYPGFATHLSRLSA